MVKISVIMPTYNVEKYFRQCLDSVVNQTLEDIEIIPVDDGSPDNCGAIMDEYAAKDPRVKPIHQKNGGYGSAVNNGIMAATGEYIGIVETDDYIEPDMYEKMYLQAKKFDADVCKCGLYNYNSLRANKKNQNKVWKNDYEHITNFPDDRPFNVLEVPAIVNYHASIWSNIYRREFLLKNNIRVNSTAGASYQDFPFMIEVMCKAERIAAIHDHMYHWRGEPNQSSSTKTKSKKYMIMADQCIEGLKIVKDCNFYEQLKEHFYSHAFRANLNFFLKIPDEFKQEYFDKLVLLFSDLKDDKDFKYTYFSEVEYNYLKCIINNQLDEFFKYHNYISNKTFAQRFLNFRKKYISLRWNNAEKSLFLFGNYRRFDDAK